MSPHAKTSGLKRNVGKERQRESVANHGLRRIARRHVKNVLLLSKNGEDLQIIHGVGCI